MKRLVLWTCILCIGAWISWSSEHTAQPAQIRSTTAAPFEVRYTKHARMRMAERGANDNEVRETLLHGEEVPAKDGKQKFEKTFPCNCTREGKFHPHKKVEVVTKKEDDEWVIITVIADYN